MIYIIIPKEGSAALGDMTEAEESWGFSSDEILIVVSPGEMAQRYQKVDFKAQLDKKRTIPPLPNNAIICYSDYGIDSDLRLLYRKLLRGLLPDEHRVFRHFGEKQLAEMSSALMQESMTKGEDSFWEERRVMPYSIKGGSDAVFKWLPIIREVRDSCFNDSRLDIAVAISKMDVAWTLADGYYNAQQPMRSMLEALFPLYLTLSESGFDEDHQAAIQATEQLIDSEAFSLIKLGIQANVSESAPSRLKEDLKLPSSAETVSDFLEWFRDLSKAYTESLRPMIVTNPFPPQFRGNSTL